jgi:diguanylate cyclase (GGDEF)-like protein
MWVIVAAYMVCLLIPDTGVAAFVNGWLNPLATWTTAAVCWLAVYRNGPTYRPALFTAVAVTSFAAGNQYYTLAVILTGAGSFPSPADIGYLGFYPCVFLALAAMFRQQKGRLSWAVVLDGAVASLAAAAPLAILLDPVFVSTAGQPPSPAAWVAAAYPMLDWLLVAVVAGMAAASDFGIGRRGPALVLGLLTFAVSDVIYAYRVSDGSYVVGTPLDAGWVLGLALVASWVGHAADGSAAKKPPSRTRTLAFSMAATLTGLAVLTAGTQAPVSLAAVVLSCLALAAAAVRTQVAFKELSTTADLRHQSRTDDLTGLLNRRAFHADFPVRLDAAAGKRGALALLDLDRFKEVNDGLGHETGDLLLAEVGKRLARFVRSKDLLARIGGDEFAVFFPDSTVEDARSAAERMRAAVVQPFTLDGIALRTDVSIGIVLAPSHGQDLGVLMRKADVAMYKAKSARTGHHVYEMRDDTHGAEKLRDLEELRAAINTDQLVLHFQPKIDLSSGNVAGVEALVRWDHPARGLLYPGHFLPLIEEAGLMPAMTEQVISRALEQARVWQEHGLGFPVAVNIAAGALADDELPDRVAALITAHGLPASRLMIEITEESLVADQGHARSILTRLRQAGIRISIDDFGTGYSSLAYLRDLPIDELKLDRSFMAGMSDNARAANLVKSIIALAHGQGMSVVAEGVEDSQTLDELARHGCDLAQGFYICRPVPAAELDAWLADRIPQRNAPVA